MYWNKISRVNKLYPLSQWMISLMKANHHFVTLSLVFSSYYYYYCDRYWWLVPISVRISTNLMSRDKQRHTFVSGWLLRVPYILFKTQYRKDIWLFHTTHNIQKFDWVWLSLTEFGRSGRGNLWLAVMTHEPYFVLFLSCDFNTSSSGPSLQSRSI